MIQLSRNQRQKPESMPKPDTPRPDFTNPPVIEVVLSVQFEPLSALGVPQLGVLWERYRKEFPNTEEKQRLSHMIEDFGPPKQQAFKVELVSEPPLPRCWFKNDAEDELIQVQNDRFIFNWRKRSNEYPRYESVRENFSKYFQDFSRFVEEYKLGDVKPNQCEVTYVNHIFPEETWERFGQLDRIFSIWSGHHSDDFLQEPEEGQFQIRYHLFEKTGKPIGRLHVAVEPRVVLDSGDKLIRMALTARGAPLADDIKGVLSFFDFGRDHIVRGFTSLTTKEMHRIWGRTDA